MTPEATERPSNAAYSADGLPSWFSFFSPSIWWLLSVATLLAGLTAAAYSNSLDVPFIFDDIPSIKQNELVFRYRSFTVEDFKRFWISRFPDGRPVSYFTFALNYCFGRFNTTGYHVVNVVIHILSGLGVFCFTRRLLCSSPVLIGDDDDGTDARQLAHLIAALTALVWTLHPVQTQSVTYIVQRMTALAGMFYFWGMYFYLRRLHARDRLRKAVFFGLVVLCFFLGIGSKQIVVTLPFAIWLVHGLFYPDSKLFGERPWVHFGGIMLFVGAAGIYLLMGQGGMSDVLDKLFRTTHYPHRHWSMPERLMTEARVVLRYLWIIFLPFPFMLNLERNPEVSTGLFTPFTTFTSLLTIVILLYIAWRCRRLYPVVSFGILWFGLHLVVTSTIIPLELMYDHRLYLPLFGPVFLLVYLSVSNLRLSMTNWIVVGVLVSILLGGSTYARNEDWSSWIRLYEDAVQKSPTDPRAHMNLGSGYKRDGETLLRSGRVEQAYSRLKNGKTHYERAYWLTRETNRQTDLKTIESGLDEVRILLAMADVRRGNVNRAFDELTCERNEDSSSAGMGLMMARSHIQNARYFTAEQLLLSTIYFRPGAHTAYYLLAKLYLDRNRPTTALEIMHNAPEPTNRMEKVRVHLIHGRVLSERDRRNEAFRKLQAALEDVKQLERSNSPLKADVHAALARFHHLLSGNHEARTKHAEAAVELNGDGMDEQIHRWASRTKE